MATPALPRRLSCARSVAWRKLATVSVAATMAVAAATMSATRRKIEKRTGGAVPVARKIMEASWVRGGVARGIRTGARR